MQISLDGLKTERNWGLIWLGVCVACWAISPPTPAYGIGVALGGILVGMVRTVLFARNQLQWGERASWLGILLLLPTIFLGWMPQGIFGALGTGACAGALLRLVPWLGESYINQKITERMKPFMDACTPQPTPEPDEALREMRKLKPDPLWDELEAGRIAGFQIRCGESLSDESTHLSCLGGTPLLPEGTPWPEHRGKPLTFLAHLNLAELAHAGSFSALPTSGVMLFFYDAQEQPWGYQPEDAGSWAIIHLPDPVWIQGPLLPVTFKPHRFFHIRDAIRSKIWELEKMLPDDKRGYFGELGFALSPGDNSHQLLGAARLVQNDMDDECETARQVYGLPGGTPWTLLLQLDSETLLGWCWGDAGVLYYWIPTEDLATARFDRVWVVLQCT